MENKHREMSSSSSRIWCLVLVLICQCHRPWSFYASLASATINPLRVKQVSWKPRAFLYEGFLTEMECDHLISIAKPNLHRSLIGDGSGVSKLSEIRTSYSMVIPKNKDPIVVSIEDKISSWTFLPKENGEDIQVFRYDRGQKFGAHVDFFFDKFNTAQGGNRFATVLMYLNNVTRGGETVFPYAEESPRHKGFETSHDLSECGNQGLAVKPRRGDALLFFDLHLNATPDISSVHMACPVIEGEKWSAAKWIHIYTFDKIVETGWECSDQDANCVNWAALGYCTKNPGYMVGTPRNLGYCMKSCKAC